MSGMFHIGGVLGVAYSRVSRGLRQPCEIYRSTGSTSSTCTYLVIRVQVEYLSARSEATLISLDSGKKMSGHV